MSEEIDGLKIDILVLEKKLDAILHDKGKDGEVVVTHLSDRYRLKIERAASTKGVDGFVVDVSGDDFDVVQNQIKALYDYAKNLTNTSIDSNIEKQG